MKSILLLGGSHQQLVAIRAAKELGYRTVLCDYLPDNPGQYEADVFYPVSTIDAEAVYQVAVKEKVDGILAYASDPAALPAAQVAERLGLPTNPSTAVEILGVKHRFRAFLAENDFACPKVHTFSAEDDEIALLKQLQGLHFPIVIKPTDSSGSKGVTKIEDLTGADARLTLHHAICHAAAYSRNQVLIAEEWIERGFPLVIGGDIFVWNGQIQLYGLMSCLRGDNGASLIPIGEKTPSGLTEAQERSIYSELQRVVSLLDIRFGEINVEILLDAADQVHFLELGPRAGGNMIPIQLSDVYGIDLVKANVLAAMGQMPEMVFNLQKDAAAYCTYVLHSKQAGTYQGVTYAPEIAPCIYRTELYKKPGDEVEIFDGAGKAVGIVFMKFENEARMNRLLQDISSNIKIQLATPNLGGGGRHTPKEKEKIFTDRTVNKYPAVWEHYTKHIAHETMTWEEMEEYNFAQRKAIVTYAYENTEFYRNRYDSAGFHPNQLQTEEDWNKVPVLTKEMVRANMDKMVVGGLDGELAKKHGKLLYTGGSTGEPLPIMRDMRYEQAGSTIWRSRGWWVGRERGQITGAEPVLGQNEGIIWRMSGVNTKDAAELEREKSLYHPMRKYYLDAQQMDDAAMNDFVTEMEEDGITFLRGYAGALVEFANYCLKNGKTIHPKAISVVSNPIDSIQRRIIKEAFDCPVFDVYGSKECQNMAHECRCSNHNLHVLNDLRHIDILDANLWPVAGEEEGTVYVTAFNNYIMPFIKYKLGDRTHWVTEKCACGLPFPLIHRIRGRESDMIHDKNGNPIYAPSSIIDSVAADFVSAYQFVVHKPGDITIKLVPNKQKTGWEKGIDRIKHSYMDTYAGRIDFTFELVDFIPHDDGKLRFIVHE